jgi:rubrerythrin
MLYHTNATKEDYDSLVEKLRRLAADESWKALANQELIDSLMDAALSIEVLIARNNYKFSMED